MIDQKLKMSSERAAILRQAIEAFYFSYRAFTVEPDRILSQKGLGRVHHRVLYFVGHNQDISVSGLLAILGVSKQALSAPLRQLIEMGLVEDRPSPDDGRVKRLRLTRAGEVLEAKLTETQLRLLDTHLREACASAAEQWMDVMKKMGGAGR